MSTDVRTGHQVDVGYWLYDVMTKIQLISDVKLTSGACWDEFIAILVCFVAFYMQMLDLRGRHVRG